ncbi:MAG TPA: response regulator [Nitrosopumilaceae archaeon]|nr:response regulator [Nitrosopumilaceae archaeon]
MKILEIDDNPDIIKYVELIATSLGHEFSSVNNGKDGLEMIYENQYDLILLDLSMPEFSGVDVIDQLISKDVMKNQRVVIFTASSAGEGNFEELKNKGVHSYLRKPIDIDSLMDKLKEIEKSL